MLYKALSVLALAGQAFAQNAPNLLEALSATPDLSSLSGVLGLNPSLVSALAGAQNITILAPSNKAFGMIPNATLQALTANTDLLTALLSYHVLNGTVRGNQITNTSAFVPTLLTNSMFTNVTGGQRINAQLRNGNVTFFSGLLDNSTVSKADVNFTGGVIHIIDRVLTLPVSVSDTLTAAGLSSLRGALNATNLTSAVKNTPNLTIFAPNNAALQSIGSGLANLKPEQITDVLQYHVVSGLGYSSTLRNGTVLTALNGKNLTVTINGGRVFVNNARVVTADVLVANGVVHIIDAVLNPTNGTVANPSASVGVPAFSGASSASDVPFTSGQPSPTRTIAPAATTAANPSQSSSSRMSAAGAPAQTGAIGMGALLGAAAVYLL
ncbi:FAS1 domain-containing protein [Phaeosphaeriaceae sp. PMI808]|nr:FAS1 domain-containing protein [Phaeosphaeriaceae sp. PMI808]